MNSPRNAQDARRLANCFEKAKAMVPELRKGGLYIPFTNPDGTYDVMKRGFDGEKDIWYRVNLMAQTCDCPDFQTHGTTCKHVLAVGMMEEEIAAEDAIQEHSRLMEDAECATGCDGAYSFDR